MELRNLGRSGLKVSLAGLGCNNFGMQIDEAESAKVIDAAIDNGINFFDEADCYGSGESERILGKVLGARRHDVIISTKFGVAMGKGPYMQGASRRYVLQAAEASLKRLGTDYIDVLFMHTPDPDTPIEETLDAMNTLVDQGKVRYLGCSNTPSWLIADAAWQARTRGLREFVTAQNEWSLLERSVESEVVPACERFGLGMLPYFPLASGALTGKYRRGQEFGKDSRYGNDKTGMFGSMYGHFVSDDSLARVEQLEKVAADLGLSLIELALSWLASQPVVSSVIAGATRPEQIEMNAKATRGDLGPEVFEAVDKALGGGA